ncbi:polysaccharide biosynthesis tyrosine autokinase [Paeniglutamicibacter gangotriensis]|uniref:non-specific protein-tyrosine kinase n=1 Tax=Paeniglutamicibacter gangotriensis Lz1y TaxID=1276920 RepID=M7MWW7_9MICC|nr:polysaccharide biosynthesis tyrosine autokinase [Paeniglutamicibacter gangotriensis]EMQ99561.1 capsular polysaccharide biosynthesis protein YveL [Paeniglutamicibacter gangotriensis Lz1y]
MEQLEENVADGPDLRQYLRTFRTFWRSITSIVLVAVICAFGWTLTQQPLYSASASGLVIATGADTAALALSGDSLAKSRAISYKSIAATRTVAERVREELKLDASAEQLLGQLEVELPTGTAEVRLKIINADPVLAQKTANAWVDALAEQVTEIESGFASGSSNDESIVQLVPLVDAEVPTSPVSPNTKLALALGAVLGLALGAGFALLRQHMDRRVRSVEDLEKLGTSVIGTIPLDPRLVKNRTTVETGALDHDDRASHPYAEALRELRTNLTYVDVDKPARVILVTSSVPGEGKSSVAANLAIAIASTGRPTILIDADLRRPVVTDIFGLPGGAGLTDVLSQQATLDDVLQPYGPIPTLSILAGGRIPPNPSELLGSQAMLSLLDDLSRDALVLIDAPPLLPVTDAAVLANFVDGVLVAVKADSTSTDEVAKSLGNLDKVGANVLGFVLNQVPTKGAGAANYGYYGQYYYAAALPEKGKGKKPKTSRRLKNAVPVDAPRRVGERQQYSYNGETVQDADTTHIQADAHFDDVLATRADMRHLRR